MQAVCLSSVSFSLSSQLLSLSLSQHSSCFASLRSRFYPSTISPTSLPDPRWGRFYQNIALPLLPSCLWPKCFALYVYTVPWFLASLFLSFLPLVSLSLGLPAVPCLLPSFLFPPLEVLIFLERPQGETSLAIGPLCPLQGLYHCPATGPRPVHFSLSLPLSWPIFIVHFTYPLLAHRNHLIKHHLFYKTTARHFNLIDICFHLLLPSTFSHMDSLVSWVHRYSLPSITCTSNPQTSLIAQAYNCTVKYHTYSPAHSQPFFAISTHHHSEYHLYNISKHCWAKKRISNHGYIWLVKESCKSWRRVYRQ